MINILGKTVQNGKQKWTYKGKPRRQLAANIPYETAHIIAAMKADTETSDSEGPPDINDLEESEKETSGKEDSTESESGEDF